MPIIYRYVKRMTVLFTLTTIIILITIVTEISIDRLTSQARDLRHLLKHSLGNIGTLMVFLSLAGYMIKRRYKEFPGKLVDWLYIHQIYATVGTLLVGIHAGAHFAAVVPIATYLFMLVCLVSGFVGRFVYMKTMKDLNVKRSELAKSGMDKEDIDEKLAFAAAAARSLTNWRSFHSPVAIFLFLLVLIHTVSALYFGG